MKRKPKTFRMSAGFTLVELLVVIAIIGTLAALAFTMGPKMMKRGAAAKATQNMRQIGSLLMGYATDHSGVLPTARPDIVDANGKAVASDTHWHQALLLQVYSDLDVKGLDLKWYNATNPFMRNPMCTKTSKPYGYDSWNPGYAINLSIGKNLKLNKSDSWDPGAGGPQTTGAPLHAIPEPGKTPIVVPRGDWHYEAANLLTSDFKAFLVDGKFPVLFVDGHVETMTPNEYALPRPKGRDLGNVPQKLN